MLIFQENTRSFLPPRVVQLRPFGENTFKKQNSVESSFICVFFEDAHHPTLSFLISLWFAMNVYSVLQGTPLDCTATIIDGSVLDLIIFDPQSFG